MVNEISARQELEQAQTELSENGGVFMKVQLEVKDKLISVAEKMSLYSAGIISLSFTFIGYLISQKSIKFSITFLYIPAYYYLYLSWALLAINLLIGLTIRKFEALYDFYGSQRKYHESRKNFQEKKIKIFNTNYPLIYNGTDKDKEIGIANSNIEILASTLIPKTLKKEDWYFKVLEFLKPASTLLFIFGILFLLTFVLIMTHQIFIL